MLGRPITWKEGIDMLRGMSEEEVAQIPSVLRRELIREQEGHNASSYFIKLKNTPNETDERKVAVAWGVKNGFLVHSHNSWISYPNKLYAGIFSLTQKGGEELFRA